MSARRATVALLVAAAAVAAMLALAGCTSTASPAPERSPFAGQWTFTGGHDARGDLEPGDAVSGLVIGSGTSVIVRGPCRDYRFDLLGQPGAVFARVTHTGFGVCDGEGVNSLDRRFFAAMQATTYAKIVGQVLHLQSRGTTLNFAPSVPVNMSALLGTAWKTQEVIYTMSNSRLTIDATLRFPTRHSLTVSVPGCATVTADLTIRVGMIVPVNERNATVDCEASGSEAIKGQIVQLIEGGFSFSGAPGGLFITNPRLQETVRFTS